MKLTTINIVIMCTALTLILGACSSQRETQPTTPSNATDTQTMSPTVTPSSSKIVGDNKEIAGLVEEVNKAKEEISKDNKLTEEEMLRIGRGIQQNSVIDFYQITNDDDLEEYLAEYYLDNNKSRHDTFEKSYKENLGIYKKGGVKLENEKVEHFGKTGFVFTADAIESGYKNDGTIETTTYKLTNNIDKDDDGKYKIVTETIE
ncbi:hypothetical protein ACF3MZ_11125 [Paenibacillaceae bacterium WGS1546]|uniref:hypothetical protein n=1 Tax=Cohnella sp. WGS1546 TaxID=3366810 RepID=UPI00372D2A00